MPDAQAPTRAPVVARVLDFLALRRSVAALLGVAVLLGLGERLGERFLPVYLLALGGGHLAIGVLQALNNALSAVYSYAAGFLSDRIGARRSLLLFTLLALVGFLLVAAIPAWPVVLAGAALFLCWNALSLPAMMSLIASVVPASKRTMGVTLHSLVRRLPMAIGPLAGGLCIGLLGETAGVRVAFALSAGLAGLGLLLLYWLLKPDAPPPPQDVPQHAVRNHPVALYHLMSPELRRLLTCDILIRFCEQIPYAFVVVWCMRDIPSPVSAMEFGVLTAIEMATAVIVYLPVAHFSDRLGKWAFIMLTFIFFTLFPIVLLLCSSFWLLVPAFVLRGLKEFGEPSRKAMILDLCPSDRRATMFGFYYLLRDLFVAVGAFAGAFLWEVSPATNFVAAAAFGLCGTIWFALGGRRQNHLASRPRVGPA